MAIIEGGAHHGALLAWTFLIVVAAVVTVVGMVLAVWQGPSAGYHALEPVAPRWVAACGAAAVPAGALGGGVLCLRALRAPFFDAVDRLSADKAVQHAAVARAGVRPVPLPAASPSLQEAPVQLLSVREETALADPAHN